MPEVDGLETARRIRRMEAPWDSIPILGITASVVANEMQQCLDAGMDRVLAKPVNERDLLETLAELIGTTPPAGQMQARALPVMVVDDTETNLELARRQLEKLGVPCQFFQQAQEALEVAKSGSFSAILLDYNMPAMSGVEFTRNLRNWERDHGGYTPIIAVSGSASPEDRKRYRAAGMDDCIEKPVRLESLRKILEPWTVMETSQSGTAREQPKQGAPAGETSEAPVQMASLAEILGTADSAALQEMLELFTEHFPSLLAALKTTASEEDGESLRDAAHAAKSAASSVAALPLKTCLEGLEKMAETASVAEVDAALSRIETEFGRILEIHIESPESPGEAR